MDYRGYNGLPKGAEAKLEVEYNFGGKKDLKKKHEFKGALDSDYLITDTLEPKKKSWSSCGALVNARVETEIEIKTGKDGGQALSTVDSLDVAAGVKYQLQWRECKP
jgi:hypothetical protein